MVIKRKFLFILLAVIFTLINCCNKEKEYASENWTQYRGPNRNGKIDSKYFKKSIDILWRYDYEGGKPTPVIIYNDIVYFGSLSGVVYAINEQGKLKWKKNVSGEITNSLAYYNNTIIVVTNSALVFGINATNGSIKWKYSFENIKNIDNEYNVFHPIIDKDKVYITCYDEIVILEVETGKLILKINDGSDFFDFDNPPLITDDAIFIKTYFPIAFDKISGKQRSLDNFSSTYNSGPYLYKNNVYFPDRYKMEGFNQKTGKKSNSIHLSPGNSFGIVDEDKFYYSYTYHSHFSSSSKICCKSLIDEKEFFCKSQSGLSMSRSRISDIIIVGNYIYYHRNNSEVYCIDKTTGAEIYSKILPSNNLSGIISYSNGKLYISSGEGKNGHNTIFVLK